MLWDNLSVPSISYYLIIQDRTDRLLWNTDNQLATCATLTFQMTTHLMIYTVILQWQEFLEKSKLAHSAIDNHCICSDTFGFYKCSKITYAENTWNQPTWILHIIFCMVPDNKQLMISAFCQFKWSRNTMTKSKPHLHPNPLLALGTFS
jgi:hypothetical protein